MSVRTVKVSNVSLRATEKEIKEFFSFSGNIEHVEMQSVNEKSNVAFVTFKNPQGADTAVLLTGATVVDQAVTVTLATDYKLPVTASTTSNTPGSPQGSAAVEKAEDVVTTMLAKGFILGKGALNRAKSFDDKHQFTSTATAKAASLDQKIGLSEKISIGATIVNDKAKEVDEKYQVSDKTKTAFAAAEQKVSTASSKIMKNPYVMTGAMWVTGAFSTVSKAAAELQEKTKKKLTEEEKSQSKSQSQPTADKDVQEVVNRDCTQKLEAPPQSQPAAEKNVQEVVDRDCTQKLEAHPQSQSAAEKNVQEVADKDCTQKLEAHPQSQSAAEKNVQEVVDKDCTQKLEAHPQSQPAAEKNVQEVVNKDTQKLEAHHDSHNTSSESPPKAPAPAPATAPAPAPAPEPAPAPATAPAPSPAPAEVPAPKADHASKP